MAKEKCDSTKKFRYVPFTDQMAKVSVEMVRWHSRSRGTGSETHLKDAIVKYIDLDYGCHFESLLDDIGYGSGAVESYAQLIHGKEKVAKALITHLKGSSSSLGTLLQLTSAFVDDLREEVEVYLWELMEAIMGIVERSHEDKALLEIAFFTLAKIFWIERRYFVRQLRQVFRRFKRLFSCKRTYLRRFTAEALAFLLRKSSAVGKFTVFLAKTTYNEVNSALLIDGISRLYFNALKVTTGQFHSTAPQLLSEILRASFEISEKGVRDVAIQILEETMRHCSTYTSKEYSGPLVNIILEQYGVAAASSITANVSVSAKLLNAWISQKRGKSLHRPSMLFQTLINVISNVSEELDQETTELLSAAIVRYHDDSGLHALVTSAVRTVMNCSHRRNFDLLLDFLYKISDVPLFDIWIMPIVGAFMSRLVALKDAELDCKIFKFYADMCNKRKPLWAYKGNRDCFFDASSHLQIRSRMTDILKSADEYDTNVVGYCLMAYPWLWRRSENPEGMKAVFRILEISMSNSSKTDARLAVLSANACLMFDPSLFNQFTLLTLLQCYENLGRNEAALRILMLALPYVRDSEELNSVSAMAKVANEILAMFGHWNSHVRQIALQIMSHFNIPLNNIENVDQANNTEVESAFSLLLRAERTPWTLEEYRSRLMILRQLTYGAHAKHMPLGCDTIIETIPLRVIIGNLYEPFTIAWNDLKNIIQEYAYGLNNDTFFTIIFSFIDHATVKITSKNDNGSNNSDALDRMISATENTSPNYYSFRLEMFRILGCISDLTERRTKLTSPLLISFFRNEYKRENLLRRRENILMSGPSGLHCVADENEDRDDRNGVDERKEGLCFGRKWIKSSLIALLELFSKFTSLKTIYMAKEIRDLYNELLMVGDETVQRLVMKCLFAYKYKYLTPYREYLENLVEERTLISSLVRFCVDGQNSVIESSHRADVMPIVLRLLYGKCSMRCKREMMERRAAIFRFLAGCTSDELNFFLKLLFAPLLKVIGEEDQSLDAFCTRTVSTFTASSMVPLLVIKGSFRSISLVATRLSPILTNAQRRFLFRVCMAAALLSRLALQNLDLVPSHLVKRLKELRRLGCSTFKELFRACQDHELEAEELNAFLIHIVVPRCTHQNSDTPEIPLTLLRLFLSWTSVPKLFYLLRLQVPLAESITRHSVISILCGMLSSKRVSELVKREIIDGILNLLTFADEVAPVSEANIDLAKLPKIAAVNGGTAMVLDELPKILDFIFNSLSLESDNRKLNMKHLEVLSRTSEFVQDKEMSGRFVSVLLTFLERGAILSDDVIQSLLLTVSCMVTVATDPAQFLKRLVNLQSSLMEHSHREALQKIEKAIVMKLKEDDGRKAELLSYIVSLDAWDSRRIGEPDYDERHSAYQSLHEALIAHETIEPVLLYLALHNDYYIITQMTDISLRSAATRNFRSIVEYFGLCDLDEHEKQDAIDSHILHLVLRGLHDHKEIIRHDFVNHLVSVIACFPAHKQLRHLVQLRNTTEVDLDFFENITHLQIHRRQRALYKLTQSLEREEVRIPNEVLLRFVLPLLQPYMLDLSSSTSALSDSALGLLTQIMRGAPWRKYFPMFDFYLKRLKKGNVNHKAIVRVIVALVDAFHFDVFNREQHEPVVKRRKINSESEVEGGDRMDTDVSSTQIEGEETTAIEQNDGITAVKSTSAMQQKVIGYLIPRLKDCATGKDLTSHRKAQSGKYYKEDDDIQRAPVALATIKLLLKMPPEVMDHNLPGIIIKMCSLLMSRSVGVREAAGKTIIEMAKTLGPKYIRFIIQEMKQSLKKGYQVHVMIFYVHKLLSAMEEQLSAGDLDSCMMDIVEVCNTDLFGDVADEKSISGITKDVPEAKTQRAYETYRLLGRHISSQYLGNILTVLKEVVESRPDSKTVKKVGRLLRQYSLGISANEGVEPKAVLVFAYQILKEHIAEVLKENRNSLMTNLRQEKGGERPESCLVLEKEPARLGVISKVSTKSKMHIFVEFGLCELYSMLKKKAFDTESKDDFARLDPFIDIVLQCLQVKYDQVLANSLRCLLLLLKFPLPSLRSSMAQFLNRLFILLADYTALGAVGGAQEFIRKPVEVSQLIFKILTQIIRDAPDLLLTSKRLQLLLTYIETNIVDNQKQAVAFPLIKAIIFRKLQDPKITEIVHYLSETAIISEVPHIREQCRQLIALYVGSHPQCKKPVKHVEFFLEQLNYQYEDGRKSAVEMLNMLFEKLPLEVNDQYALLAFVKLATRLINDESTQSRQMVALALLHLLKSISESKRNDLYLATRDWLESEKESYVCIAVQMLLIFSKLKGEIFENTLRELFPILSEIIRADVLFSYAEESIGIIIDGLTLLLIMHKNQIPLFVKAGLLDSILREMGSFAGCHESSVLQLAAARFLGLIFSTLDQESLLSRNDPSPRQFMQWMLAQFKTYELSGELAEQIAKNTIYLFDAVVQSDEDLKWLCHRLAVLCKFESVKLPVDFVRRINIFKVIAVIILKIEPYRSDIVMEAVLPSLYREMQGKTMQNSKVLQQVATEVAETIKGRVGEDKFAKRVAACHKLLATKFEERKRKKKEEVVLNPTIVARKKLRKNKAKQGMIKRKNDMKRMK